MSRIFTEIELSTGKAKSPIADTVAALKSEISSL